MPLEKEYRLTDRTGTLLSDKNARYIFRIERWCGSQGTIWKERNIIRGSGKKLRIFSQWCSFWQNGHQKKVAVKKYFVDSV